MNLFRERIAIMIDYHDFWEGSIPDITFWQNLNSWLLHQFVIRTSVTPNQIVHMGTWMYAEDVSRIPALKEKFNTIDNEHGFIVQYGISPDKKRKGIETKLVCQMLIGAFEDRYDACILMSDNWEFEPAIQKVQNMYGKRVFHAGFEKERLRAACFGNFQLETCATEKCDPVNSFEEMVSNFIVNSK